MIVMLVLTIAAMRFPVRARRRRHGFDRGVNCARSSIPRVFLDRVDLGHRVLEAVLAELLVLAPLEFLSERVVFGVGHDVVKRGNSTVSSRAACGSYMRMNAASSARSWAALGVLEDAGDRQALDPLGGPPARLMLRAKDAHQLDELVGAFEAREQDLLFCFS
jgi:hypothetical protein